MVNWIAKLFTKIVVWIFSEWIIASAWALSCHNGPCSKCVCVWLHWTRGKWHRVFYKYVPIKKQEILCDTPPWPAYADVGYASQPPIPCHVPIQIIPQQDSSAWAETPITRTVSVNYQPYLGFWFHKWLNEMGFLLAAKSEGFILWQGLPLEEGQNKYF